MIDRKIPLLPQIGLALTVPAETEFWTYRLNSQRANETPLPIAGVTFAKEFVSTWKRIPMDARRTLVNHWRKGKQQGEQLIVTLKYDILGVGMCTNLGMTLNFAPELEMSREWLSYVIAHELAHVYRWATVNHLYLAAEHFEAEVLSEYRTDYLVNEWGLSYRDFFEWNWREQVDAWRAYMLGGRSL